MWGLIRRPLKKRTKKPAKGLYYLRFFAVLPPRGGFRITIGVNGGNSDGGANVNRFCAPGCAAAALNRSCAFLNVFSSVRPCVTVGGLVSIL